MVFGPPGTGKTTYLLRKLEELLKTYAPEEIAFVSFTKKGAYEGKERAIKKFGFAENQTPYFRTLHSIAFRELGLKVSDMVDRGHYKDFSHATGMNFVGYYTEELKHNDDAYLFYDGMYRNNKRGSQNLLKTLDIDKLKFVRNNYKKFKEHYHLLDFTDIIEMCVNKGVKLPVKVAIVDEAQDLTTLQWKMVMTAFRGCRELYLAGDDDQAIYEWSGADVNYFLNVEHTSFKLLDKSYRLPDNILDFSKRITDNIKTRVSKDYHGNGTTGNIEMIGTLDDLNIDSESSWLFLSRNNTFLNKIKQHFATKGMLFNFKNEPSIKKTELDAVVQYTRFQKLNDKKAPIPNVLRTALKSKYNLKSDWYDAFKWSKDKIEYVRDLVKNGVHKEDELKTNININTIHTVKGGEADNVVVLQDITRNIKTNLENNPDSEHRIFYVRRRVQKGIFI